jgi:hypothetical protein
LFWGEGKGSKGFVEDLLKGEKNKYREYWQLLISWVSCCVYAFKFTQFKNAPTPPPPPPKKNYLGSRSTHKWNLEIKFLGFKFDISKTIFFGFDFDFNN